MGYSRLNEGQLSPWFGISVVWYEDDVVAKSYCLCSWESSYWHYLTLETTVWRTGRRCMDISSAWRLHAHLCNCLRQTFFLSFFPFSYFSSVTSFHREKLPIHVFSPKYTKLRDWHHEVSARVLNVQWFYPSCKSKIQILPFFFSICFAKIK